MNPIQFSSKRLILRPIRRSDIHAIHALLSLPETDRYNALGLPENLAATESNVAMWISDMETPALNHTLAVVKPDGDLKDEKSAESDGDLIGLFGIKLSSAKYSRAELWYKFHLDHWGQGYATEATRAAIEYCFVELDLHRIQAGAAVDNIGSLRVMEKCGLRREGRHRQELPLKTGFSDTYSYAILKSEWKSRDRYGTDTSYFRF